jgi:hypothetical protein
MPTSHNPCKTPGERQAPTSHNRRKTPEER